ncbi:MAG: DNA methylase [Solobacterium sp.]|nr:DNA methylase [Solobacterium sp.]
MGERIYAAIDLKSFYASVECVERGLDPLTSNLVVADEERTEKTICLAVSPSLKQYGIGGRARLFEVVAAVKQINAERRRKICGGFRSASVDDRDLKQDPYLELQYVTAKPRMALYIEYSSRIYEIYLKYVAKEDIHVYSIDEVFIDLTAYLKTYRMTARELTMKMIRDVLMTTGITATGGIGTNLYLAKAAMDIVAKHIPADKDGVRIAEIDEIGYRRLLWNHTPLTDFWRVGKGIARKLQANGMYTMGDVARRSLENEDQLYKLFGINAELLIDHAWGYESCTIAEIQKYKPQSSSISSGQVLAEGYSYEKGKLIVKEMADALALQLTEKGLVADVFGLRIGYDRGHTDDYQGEMVQDWYGRIVPKPVNATVRVRYRTNAAGVIRKALTAVYEKSVDRSLLVRRVDVMAGNVYESERAPAVYEQANLFEDPDVKEAQRKQAEQERQEEENVQKAILEIKRRYGKNAVVTGKNLEDGATARERNAQIGGHKA